MGETIADVSRRVVERGDVQSETDAHGRITVRRARYGALKGRLAGAFGVSPDFSIKLDPLGSAAWLLIDGQRTVADVKAELQRQFPQETDITPRLGKFLGTMVSHQMVRLR